MKLAKQGKFPDLIRQRDCENSISSDNGCRTLIADIEWLGKRKDLIGEVATVSRSD